MCSAHLSCANDKERGAYLNAYYFNASSFEFGSMLTRQLIIGDDNVNF
jgi:hypothetical protein